MLESVSSTSLVVLVDDPKINNQLAEFMLQVQGGLTQGSSQRGMSTPKGTLLLTSNEKEAERVLGRVIRISFQKDQTFTDICDTRLHNELLPLVNTYKGLLIAWAIAARSKWSQLRTNVISALQPILSVVLPHEDKRWYKGVADMIYAYALLHASVNIPFDLETLLIEFARHNNQDCIPSFSVRIQLSIQAKIKGNRENVLTWINPSVSVNRNGVYTSAIALKNTVLDSFSNITRQEVKDSCQNMKLSKAYSQSIAFATGNNVTLSDLSKRKEGLHKNQKATKIPKDALDDVIISQINNAVNGNTAEDVDDNEEFTWSPAVDATAFNMEEKAKLTSLTEQIIMEMEGWMSCDSANEVVTEDEDTMSLDPHYRRIFTSYLTPRRKEAFKQGYEACMLAKTDTVGPSSSLTEASTSTAQTIGHVHEQIEDKNSESESSQLSDVTLPAKRRLFPTGTIGAITKKLYVKTQSVTTTNIAARKQSKRNGKQPSKKNDQRIGVDVCAICRRKECYQARSGVWIGCDQCSKWFHRECANVEELPPENQPWYCPECQSELIDNDV